MNNATEKKFIEIQELYGSHSEAARQLGIGVRHYRRLREMAKEGNLPKRWKLFFEMAANRQTKKQENRQ